jgi:hypothetical protein
MNERVHVQKNLLCDISEKMRDLVEAAEKAQVKLSPQSHKTKRKRLPFLVRLQILDDVQQGVEYGRALDLWSGFMHG